MQYLLHGTDDDENETLELSKETYRVLFRAPRIGQVAALPSEDLSAGQRELTNAVIASQKPQKPLSQHNIVPSSREKECLLPAKKTMPLHLEGKISSSPEERESTSKRKVRSSSWKLLGDDLIHRILSFSADINTLQSFTFISKWEQVFMAHPEYTEDLLREAYIYAYGYEFAQDACRQLTVEAYSFESRVFWRDVWKRAYLLRKGFEVQTDLVERGIPQNQVTEECKISLKLRQSVGILSRTEEEQAVLYDNPSKVLPGHEDHSFGYFGMVSLDIDILTNRTVNGKRADRDGKLTNDKPIVVFGDYSGARIFRSLKEMIYESGGKKKCASGVLHRSTTTSPAQFCSVGAHNGGGQVLTVIVCSPRHLSLMTNDSTGHASCTKPCFFLGFASGMVMAVGAEGADEREYNAISTMTVHTNEVTSLAFIPWSNKRGSPRYSLVSASVDGKVFLYPYALRGDQGFSLDGPILAFTNISNTPIISITATMNSIAHGNVTSNAVMICTGDQEGNVRVWHSKCELSNSFARAVINRQPNISLDDESDLNISDDNLRQYGNGVEHAEFSASEPNFDYHFKLLQTCSTSSPQSSGVIVTLIKFARKDVLMSGSNEGDICFWDLKLHLPDLMQAKDSSRHTMITDSNSPKLMPNLVLRHRISTAHNGTVESVEVCGNVALTSGGNEGEVKAWNIQSGNLLGQVRCHQGVVFPPPLPSSTKKGRGRKLLRRAVIGSTIYQGNIISVCRDGTLHVWDYRSITDAYNVSLIDG